MMQFTLPEISKCHVVPLGIHLRALIQKVFECQFEDSAEDLKKLDEFLDDYKGTINQKLLQNLLARSRLLLTTMPASQSVPQPEIWEYLSSLSDSA